MPFTTIDAAAVARSLAQIADRPEDVADAFFERVERIELPPEEAAPGIRVWRETGLAVRMLRAGQTWLAGRDRCDREAFTDAWRRVARALPRAVYPQPELSAERWDEPPRAPELLEFPSLVGRALRAHGAGAPLRLTVSRHRRWVRTIGTRLASATERESFYSFEARTPAARLGGLLTTLGDDAAQEIARGLAALARAAAAPAPETAGVAVLGPSAAAVLLHELIAHALEADTLALRGPPEAAIGGRLAGAVLNVFDDPASAPEGVRRTADDEGFPVVRRCLLRAGRIEQPLCDVAWARRSEVLVAGAGRRGSRHHPPGPRSSHLELATGDLTRQELLADADGGLYLPAAERGVFDPLSGALVLRFPYGRLIENGVPGPPVGPCTLRGPADELLARVTGVGSEARAAGAGWCAKGGVKLPVWATSPELRLDGVEIGR